MVWSRLLGVMRRLYADSKENPGWDAQNLWFAVQAKKLGYRLDYEYMVYEIGRY